MNSPMKKNRYLAAGLFFVLFILMHYLGWTRRYEDMIRNFTVPILSDIHGISIQTGSNYQFFKNRADFIRAYNECSINSEKYALLTSQISRLTDENSELRTQLNYFQGKGAKHLLANIVGREILGTEQTI
ncbi:MAG: hypothetical protein AAB467_05040, partial [Patescibacteria group bacterium]